MKSLLSFRKRSHRDILRNLVQANLPRSARGRALDDDVSLREVGLDSLAVLLVVTAFCDRYSIPIESLDGNVSTLKTVGELLTLGEQILREHGT